MMPLTNNLDQEETQNNVSDEDPTIAVALNAHQTSSQVELAQYHH